jgi:hypothetical protein
MASLHCCQTSGGVPLDVDRGDHDFRSLADRTWYIHSYVRTSDMGENTIKYPRSSKALPAELSQADNLMPNVEYACVYVCTIIMHTQS